MQIPKAIRELKQITGTYTRFLEGIQDVDFQQKPASGGWSYAEVYAHIFDFSILSLDAALTCKNEGKLHKPTALIVRVILFFGSFPPYARYKVPEELPSRANQVSSAEANVLIHRFLVQLEKSIPQLMQTDPVLKVRHPRLGYLNAWDWLRFMSIHLNHHLRQLHRIEKELKFTSLRR